MRWTINLEGGPRRVNHSAVAIGDKIYSFGGYCSGENRSRLCPIDVHVLDTATYRWTRVFGEQPCKKVKINHRAQESPDNSISTGFDSDGEDVEFEIEDEIMDEQRDEEMDQPQLDWQYNPLAPVPEANMEGTAEEDGFTSVPYMRYGHTTVAYKDKAYLFGGRNDDYGSSQRLYEYNPDTNTWSSVEAEGCIPARDGHSAVLYENQMIIFGGFEEENQRFSQETYSFDFTTRKWTELKCEGIKPSHRDFHAATVLGDKMYVFGGRSDERGQWHSSIDFYDNQLHVLDLKTLQWSAPATTNSPPGRRSNTLWTHCGRIYLFGGFESKHNRHFSDLYCFNPQDNTWAQLKPAGASHPVPRRRQCSVMVGSRAFIFGGTRPHDSKRNALVDLGDLWVLDFENSLFSICVENLLASGYYSKYSHLIPECIQEEIQFMITPNTMSRVSRTSNSSG